MFTPQRTNKSHSCASCKSNLNCCQKFHTPRYKDDLDRSDSEETLEIDNECQDKRHFFSNLEANDLEDLLIIRDQDIVFDISKEV